MFKIIFSAVTIIFVFIGICCVLSFLLIKASAPDKRKKYSVVCVLESCDGHRKLRLRWISDIISAFGMREYFRIIAVEDGIGKEEAAELKKIFADKDFIVFTTQKTLYEKISR